MDSRDDQARTIRLRGDGELDLKRACLAVARIADPWRNDVSTELAEE
jgi:hypothetical protein